MHRPARKRYERNPVIVSGIDDTFQADLIDMSGLKEANDGYTFLLSCIDVFSKFAWVVPIKDKTAKSVKEAFERIFSDERIPKRIQTDEGNEFLNKTLKTLLGKLGIKLYVVNSEKKASVVERFNNERKNVALFYVYSKTSLHRCASRSGYFIQRQFS